MIENDDNLLLLKDLFPDSWSSNPEFSKYINELCSFGISRLYNEPANLAEERSQILGETQKLAFTNYKTFIQTADCCKEVFQDFQIVEYHLDEMLTKLPKLQSAYSNFISEASQINSSRKLNTMTLLKHPQLLEILELPQLMDTCVRNAYYDEALELAEYSRRLAKRHSNIPVICKIVNEIKVAMDVMLMQLLGQLRQDLQLPTCLRVIGYLRRINAFTELELRLKFLQIRSEWFQNTLKSIPNDDPFHHISKTIELSRVHLFDIVTQYRAIFSEDEFAFIKDTDSDNSALFYAWIIQKISEFLETLKADIGRGVGNRLDSLLGQCMYFGLSFGRVGLDFRNLMVPMFDNAAQTMLADCVEAAEHKLDESLKVYSLLGGSATTPNFILPLQPANNLQPPGALMEFPPLAIYCNDLLVTFNHLRLCMPLSLATRVACILQKSLTNVATFLLTFYRVDESTFNAKELELFNRLCGVFANDVLPFINVCLRHLFPPAQLAQVAAISTADISKALVGIVDIEKIVLPLKHLIPQPQIFEPIMPDSNVNVNIQVDTNIIVSPIINSNVQADIITHTDSDINRSIEVNTGLDKTFDVQLKANKGVELNNETNSSANADIPTNVPANVYDSELLNLKIIHSDQKESHAIKDQEVTNHPIVNTLNEVINNPDVYTLDEITNHLIVNKLNDLTNYPDVNTMDEVTNHPDVNKFQAIKDLSVNDLVNNNLNMTK